MLRRIQRISNVVLEGAAWAGALPAAGFLLVLVGVIFIGVVTRKIPGIQPLMGSDELGGYAFITLAFLGGIWATRQGTHVRLEFLTGRVPKKVANYMWLISSVMTLGLIVWAGYYFVHTWLYFVESGRYEATILKPPTALPYTTLALGYFLLFWGQFSVIFKALDAVLKK